ncbi:MAG: hypothetical protein Q9178_005902 [Gyalolechia marmorata]
MHILRCPDEDLQRNLQKGALIASRKFRSSDNTRSVSYLPQEERTPTAAMYINLRLILAFASLTSVQGAPAFTKRETMLGRAFGRDAWSGPAVTWERGSVLEPAVAAKRDTLPEQVVPLESDGVPEQLGKAF